MIPRWGIVEGFLEVLRCCRQFLRFLISPVAQWQRPNTNGPIAMPSASGNGTNANAPDAHGPMPLPSLIDYLLMNYLITEIIN